MPSQCVVTVTARKLQGDLGRRGFDHLFITTWDTSTNRTNYFGAVGAGGGSGHIGGLLVGTADLFDAPHAGADFENPDIVSQWHEVLGGTCDDLFNRLALATGRINDKKLKYDGAFGPNSNSFAYTLLKQGNFTSLISQIDSWRKANSFWMNIPGTPIPVKVSPIPGWGQDLL